MNKWTWEGTYFLIICLSNQQNLPELDGYSIPPSPSPRTHPKVKHSTNRKSHVMTMMFITLAVSNIFQNYDFCRLELGQFLTDDNNC